MHHWRHALIATLATCALTAQAGETSATLTQEQVADEAIRILEKSELPTDTRINMMENLLRGHPETPEAWAALGELRMEEGEDEAALAAFNRAVEKDPTLYSSWHWIGILKKRDGKDLEGALAAFRSALDKGAPAPREYNEIGVTLAHLGRGPEALESWKKAMTADPDWGVPFSNAVKISLSMGDEKGAREAFESGLRCKRFEENTALHLGEYLIQKKKVADAVKVYAQAVAAQPSAATVRYYYGLALNDQGSSAEAVEQLYKARELAGTGPDGADVRRGVTQTLFSIQHRKEWKKFQAAREVVIPTTGTPSTGTRRTKELNAALDDLSAIITSQPDFWNAVFLRGVAYMQLQQTADAKKDFERVLQLYPDEPSTTLQMGLALHDEGKLPESLVHLRKAVELAPRDPSVLLFAGIAMIDAGACPEARKLYDRIRILVPPEQIPKGRQDPFAPLAEKLASSCK